MTEAELGEALRVLGMDRDSWRALPLLPLVQVAWADGRVQDTERELILALATERFHLEDEGRRLLRNWLHHPPSATYVRSGHTALLELCRHASTPVGPETLRDVITFAQQVAEAAGGFYGVGAVGRAEAEVIEQIAQGLHIEHDRAWVTPDDTTMVRFDGDAEGSGPAPEIVFHPIEGHSRGTLVRYDMAEGEQICPVTEAGVTIGRARENAVQISYDGEVSRIHCRLYQREDRFYVEDLQSTGGTWVNGERVLERRLLGGEKLYVGSASFFFQLSPP